jgi:hypothetical protein
MPEQEPQVGQAERSISAVGVADRVVDGLDHRVDEVEACRADAGSPMTAVLPASIGPPETKTRDVQPQRGQQHAGGDLVAVGDADQRVGAVGVDHVLDRCRR